jgi:hypothetical protein
MPRIILLSRQSCPFGSSFRARDLLKAGTVASTSADGMGKSELAINGGFAGKVSSTPKVSHSCSLVREKGVSKGNRM